ncbi:MULTISPECIES: hypothetical protein [unclassified Bradyrhizobium]|uniref:hypothetical protein n=1 Tax=unclassified Bradyrhizobium TaxID=2631580 RepID=UPI00209F734B|nr:MULTISPECIES: hypothetical protein [unclassified Bradyrhizobium]MCP1838306.1 hypothetical protein [Bradyrhizobium sp. USDA 4538]MCP1898870.1 hypothetical protein [Bradyrhizobium sp. USDA 4537]MCP1909364.1 hypothetical protein [Bradyrhizobium elkanii]MCP1987016.1 hypothetical protein [Bradyrhizobium sp. USDA 4539]
MTPSQHGRRRRKLLLDSSGLSAAAEQQAGCDATAGRLYVASFRRTYAIATAWGETLISSAFRKLAAAQIADLIVAETAAA